MNLISGCYLHVISKIVPPYCPPYISIKTQQKHDKYQDFSPLLPTLNIALPNSLFYLISHHYTDMRALPGNIHDLKFFCHLSCNKSSISQYPTPFHFFLLSPPSRLQRVNLRVSAVIENVEDMGEVTGFVVQRQRAGLWYPSPRVQTQPKPLDFSGRKNPQHPFLRRGSKAACPMSQIYGM